MIGTPFQRRTEHPATVAWLICALVRLRIRMGARQLELWRKR